MKKGLRNYIETSLIQNSLEKIENINFEQDPRKLLIKLIILTKYFIQEKSKQYHKELIAIIVDKAVIEVKEWIKNGSVSRVLKNDNTIKMEELEEVGI